MIELFILLSFFACYGLRVMTFGELTSHFGPFRDWNKKVRRIHRDENGEIAEIYEAPVTLIDWMRRLTPMNPYIVFDNVWSIDDIKIEVWECGKCLSPYVSFAVVTPMMLLSGHFIEIPLMWGAVTGGAYFLYTAINFFQEKSALDIRVITGSEQ